MSTVSPSSAMVKYDEDIVRADELQIGSVVEGVIDGEFEGGYLVTVKFGSQVLTGVLYPCANRPTCQLQETMGTPPSGMPPASQRQAKKKARVPTEVDSQMPKCHRSVCNFVFPEERIITKTIGCMCGGNLSESEKQVYLDKGLKTAVLDYMSAHEGGASAYAGATVAP